MDKKKIIIYTAIFGGYDGLIKQPLLDGVDYVCYTDKNIQSSVWDVIKVTPPVPNDNTRSNRYYKILPHHHIKNYDISIYIDGNVLVRKDITKLIQTVLKNHNMACFDHAQNKADPRNCIYKEYEEIMRIGEYNGDYKDDPLTMAKQIEQFREEGYPENHGLITCPVLIRKHAEPDVIEVMEKWWDIVLNQSKRDQLSFNYVAWKLNFTNYYLINGDVRKNNPWFYTLGTHRKNYLKKYIQYKIKTFFS